MGKNRIRITCDPYHETIKYEWYEEGERQDLSMDDISIFSNDDFLNGSLSNKAVEIIKVLIEKHYCNENGLIIEFVGTDDDFDYFDSIINTYYSDSQIELQRADEYIIKASDALPKIDKLLKDLESSLKENANNNSAGLLKKYNETVKPEIAICVMGLYSSGKSAFINSLIGKEILSSASNPETAKIYKISNSKATQIAFQYNGEPCKISFTKKLSKYDKKKFSNADCINTANSYLKEKKIEGAEKRLYYFLQKLNEYAAKDNKKANPEIGDVIEISVPFGQTYLPIDKYEFVIYDTPGTDSASNPEHFEVLKKSLEEQTSGLPILVSTPDSMDNSNYKDLIESKDEYGRALDLENLIIVVNKSDGKSTNELLRLTETIDKMIVTENEYKNLYFASSVIGLGAKKCLDNIDEWLDEDYECTFFDKNSRFENRNHKFYTRLYDYNIVPENIKDKTLTHCDVDSDDKYFLWNSGIPSIEIGIGNFAEKFAQYNKCNQAVIILGKLVDFLNACISSKTEECEKDRAEILDKIKEQQTQLINDLNSLTIEKIEKYQTEFLSRVTNNLVKEFTGVAKSQQDVADFATIKKDCKGKRDSEKVKEFENKLNEKLKKEANDYKTEFEKNAKEYWKNCEEDFQESIEEIVTESKQLTEEQKRELLSEIEKAISSINIGGIKQEDYIIKKGLWIFKTTKIDVVKAQEKYIEKLNFYIGEINYNNNNESNTKLKEYCEKAKKKCEESIAILNPELKEKKEQLDKKEKELKALKQQKEQVEKSGKEIETVLDVKEM